MGRGFGFLGVFFCVVGLKCGFVLCWFWWGFFSQKKLYLSNFCLGRIVIVGVIVLALCYLLCYSQFPGWQH